MLNYTSALMRTKYKTKEYIKMGLDMYLFKCKKAAYESGNRAEISAAFKKGLRSYWYREKPKNSPSMVCWRYANQVYRWLLEHTDVDVNSEDYVKISRHEILSLLQTCHMVLNTGIDDNGTPKQSVCEKLLPTMDGPNFGELEYNEFYVEQVRETFDDVQALFESVDFENEVLLFDAWW